MSDKKHIAIITPIATDVQVTSKCCVCSPLKFACFTFAYLVVIINTFTTLMIIGGLIMIGVMTDGFTDSSYLFPDSYPVNESVLFYCLLVTAVVLFLNVAWLCWSIYLLVGLHKKRPGSIRLNVSITAVRFVLLFIPLVMSISPGVDIILVLIEIGITGFFIFFYYLYAKQLTCKQNPIIYNIESQQAPDVSITDVYFAYPKNLDKQHLVEKEKY